VITLRHTRIDTDALRCANFYAHMARVNELMAAAVSHTTHDTGDQFAILSTITQWLHAYDATHADNTARVDAVESDEYARAADDTATASRMYTKWLYGAGEYVTHRQISTIEGVFMRRHKALHRAGRHCEYDANMTEYKRKWYAITERRHSIQSYLSYAHSYYTWRQHAAYLKGNNK